MLETWSRAALLVMGGLVSVGAFDFTGFHTKQAFDGSNSKPTLDFYWKVAGSKVQIGMTLDRLGVWFGMGVSTSGSMKGADYAIFTPSADATYTVGDYWSEGFQKPTLDDFSNIELVTQETNGGSVTVVWERDLITCDRYQDNPILNRTFDKLVFAVGGSSDLSYHGSEMRTNLEINWHKGDTFALMEAEMEKDAWSVDVLLPPSKSFTLNPSKGKTSYQCMFIPITPLTQDQHIIKLEPLISSKFAHHMLLFACEHQLTEFYGKPITESEPFDCSIMIPMGCKSLPSWAVGAGARHLDKRAGTLLSKNTKFIFLQSHLDNPAFETGIDRSGMRYFMTPTLRPVSVATTVMDYSTRGILLQRAPSTQLSVSCPKECTANINPTFITEVAFHMHEFGRYAYLEHWRNGVRLPDIAQQYWDFNYQSPNVVPNGGVSFLPGDEMRLVCEFDTSQASKNFVLGGDGTDNEMCLAFIQHFPPSNLQACQRNDMAYRLAGFQSDNIYCVSGRNELNGLSALAHELANLSRPQIFEKLAKNRVPNIPRAVDKRSDDGRLCPGQTDPPPAAVGETTMLTQVLDSGASGAPGVPALLFGLWVLWLSL